MVKKVVVISLGGSLIVPDRINIELLRKFKEVLMKNKKGYKFIIVCGGGKIARIYMKSLENERIKKKIYFQGHLGVSITRLNARLLTYFFGNDANEGIPHDAKHVKNLLRFNDFVFCGGLKYHKKETSDATAAKLASYFNTVFINLTNVSGLYDKDPKKFKKTKFIHEISHKAFYKIAKKIEYKPGIHFVLDPQTAKIIKKHKITTFILGPDMKNLDNLLNKKHFVGTIIS